MKRNGRSRIMVGALVALVFALSSSVAFAVPVNYTFNGRIDVGEITLSDGTFSLLDSSLFSIKVTADTSNITTAGGVSSLIGAGTISIDTTGISALGSDYLELGILTGTINDSLTLFFDPGYSDVFNGTIHYGIMGFDINPGDPTTTNTLFYYGASTSPTGDLTNTFSPAYFGENSLFASLGASLALDSGLTGDLLIEEASAVPEPSTFLLIGGGLACLAFWRRRKA